MTKWILSICILIVFSVFFLNLLGGAIAEDCQTDGKSAPTPPGDTEYPDYWNCECTGEKPTIEADYSNPDDDTIDSGYPVILSATDGCPSYTWSTGSLGYSLTDNGDGTVTLSVVSGTCGTDYDVYAIVTVTDCCENPGSIVIRNTAGEWVEVGTKVGVICTPYDYDRYQIKNAQEYVDGNRKWRFSYSYGCYDRDNGCQTASWDDDDTTGDPVDPWCDPRDAWETYSDDRCDSLTWSYSMLYRYYEWQCP